jgi:hypothetical protein
MNTSSFAKVPHGTLRVGTRTYLGVIEAVSLTAYRINGTWVPFLKIHGAYPVAQPLIWG